MTTEPETIARYKYIHFVEIGTAHKRPGYSCRNNRTNGTLGLVDWYPPWRQYTFTVWSDDIVFNKECLENIADFLGKVGKA
jgi:hypothetical protein